MSPNLDTTSPHTPQSDFTALKNLEWLYVLRNLIIIAVSLVIFVSIYGMSFALPERALWLTTGVLVLFNLLTRHQIRTGTDIKESDLFMHLVFDVLGISALLYCTGGATNPVAWIFLLPLTITATILPQVYTWYMVILTTTCYTILIGYHIPLPEIEAALPPGDLSLPIETLKFQHMMDLHTFAMWFGFVLSAAIVAYFVVAMANTLRERDNMLAEARELALRRERVVALGTLAASAAHEMSTPLGTMAILAHDLELEFSNEEAGDLKRKMKIMCEQIDRCKKALSVMSASAGEIRAESGKALPLELFLNELFKQWHQQRPSNRLNYTRSGTTPEPMILADRTLYHALINILNNATDASPLGIEFCVSWTSKAVTLLICDSGSGFDPQIIAAAGKTMISTKEQGLGVGLLLAFATIEQLSGHIEIYNRESGGACINILLPTIQDEKTGSYNDED